MRGRPGRNLSDAFGQGGGTRARVVRRARRPHHGGRPRGRIYSGADHQVAQALHGAGVQLRDARLADAELHAQVLEAHALEVMLADDVPLALGKLIDGALELALVVSFAELGFAARRERETATLFEL